MIFHYLFSNRNDFFNNMKSDELHDDDKMVIWKTPFYGVRGTISKVVDNDGCFLVTRYDDKGNDGEVLPTPKRRKKELYDDYIHDVKGYLEANHSQFLTCLKEQAKDGILMNKRLIKVLIASILTVLCGFSMMVASGSLLYFSIVSFIVCFVTSSFQIRDYKDGVRDIKRQNFIHEYKEYVNELNQYNMDKERFYSHQTKYSNIINDEDKVFDLHMKLTRHK